MPFASPGGRRAVAVAMAALWVLGLCASMAHSADHQHRYCEQHHAVEDVPLRAREGVGTEQARSDRSAHVEEAPSEAADDHEACPFANFSLQSRPACANTRVLAVPAVPAPPATIVVAILAPPISILHLAPKSSPPSASV